MKKTQLKDALKNVRKQFVSFISVVLVIALGTGLFLVCRLGRIAAANAGNAYYNEHGFYDLEIKATKGITQDDIKAVKKLDFVVAAEGVISVNMVAKHGNARNSVTVLSPTKKINIPEVISGDMPKNEGECILSYDLAEKLGVTLGDTVDLFGPETLPDFLKTYRYTITGIMVHPLKIRVEEISSTQIILSDASFDREALGVDYTGILIRTNADPDAFSAEYRKQLNSFAEALNILGKERTGIRDEEINGEAIKKIKTGEKLLKEAKARIEEARQKIEEGESSLAQGSRILNAAEAVAGLLRELMDSIAEKLAIPVAEIESIISGLLPFSGSDDEKAEKENLIGRYSDVGEILDRLQEVIANKTAEYKDGLERIKESRAALREKEAEYEDNERKINDAKKSLSEYDCDRWIVLTRVQNKSFYELAETVVSFSNIGSSFALLFMLLGILVCYATIGKIIDEQKKLVGTTKAIGFTRNEIFGKYLIFGVGGASAGAVAGCLLSFFLLQPIMIGATQDKYLIGNFKWVFEPSSAIISLIVAALTGAVATYFACGKLLKKPAVKLINGEVKGTLNKEKTLPDGARPKSLYTGLIFRNMRDDIKRVMITVACVAGCTVLLVIGFSIKFSFDNVVNSYFRETILYDSTVSFHADAEGEAEKAIGKVIDENAEDKMKIYLLNTVMRIGSERETAQILCADPDELLNFANLYDITKQKSTRIPDGGIMIFSRLAEVYKLNVGDVVSIMGNDGAYRDVTIAGIYNSYVGRSVFMSEEYGKKVFGDTYRTNGFAVKHAEGPQDKFLNDLSCEDSFVELLSSEELIKKTKSTATTMNIVVYVMIVMSAIMAGVVLLNLVRIQLNQKKRELRVMRINGFTIRETAGYILKENAITTAAGIVLGVIVGCAVARYNLGTLERVDLQMIREISVPACIFSALITLLFAAIINYIALRSIKKLRLTGLD